MARTRRLTGAQRADLDETRRLLYMALVASRTKRYNLAGTLINAIKHHQGVDIDPDASPGHASDMLIGRVVAYVDGAGDDDDWLTEQIERLVTELDEG